MKLEFAFRFDACSLASWLINNLSLTWSTQAGCYQSWHWTLIRMPLISIISKVLYMHDILCSAQWVWSHLYYSTTAARKQLVIEKTKIRFIRNSRAACTLLYKKKIERELSDKKCSRCKEDILTENSVVTSCLSTPLYFYHMKQEYILAENC